MIEVINKYLVMKKSEIYYHIIIFVLILFKIKGLAIEKNYLEIILDVK